jgi:predicted nucleic acid-binding protein
MQYREIIYLDSCIIIAWIKNEARPDREMEGVEYCFGRINNNEIKAITSENTIGELLPGTFPSGAYDHFMRTVFKRRNFEFVITDRRILFLAQEIRNYYESLKKIKLSDAIHLATAIHYKANSFYTFDEKRLLPLNGNVAGYNLLICKPPLSGQGRLPF